MHKGIRSEMIEQVIAFSKDRDWEQFHNPKDLAISISIEAAELLENFQWTGSSTEGKDSKNMKEELADVMIYCILMGHAMNVDLESIIREKLAQDGEKYPVSKAKGNAKKYTEF